MAVKKKGLGKGLDSLIPDNKSIKSIQPAKVSAPKKEEKIKDGVLMMKTNEVEPNREQPRKNFDEDALLELADSIKQFGVLQPLLVRKRKDYYEIIAGERRWRAAKMAGVKEVPVIIKEYTDQEILEIGLIENIQRENLNPIEEAIAFKRLLEEFNLKQDEVAERVSKSRTAVTNSMRLLKLNDKVQQMIIDDMISTGHARALLAIDDPELQYTLANKIFDEKLSVREIEKLVKEIKNPKKKKEKKKAENEFIYRDLEDKMKDVFGTKVSIASKGKGKGKIEIEYYSDDELEHLFDMMMTIKRGVYLNMDSKILKALGIDPVLILIFLLILIVVLFGLYVNVTMKYNRLKSSYTTFMRGKDGRTLEESMMSGFADVESVLKYTKQNRLDIQKINKRMEKSYQKLGIVKYDAFNEMGGKLSFALAMLDNNNTGWIINAMHSREGCYTYVKEIVKGESYVELAEEEAEALDKAIFEDGYVDEVEQAVASIGGNANSGASTTANQKNSNVRSGATAAAKTGNGRSVNTRNKKSV